ncbi:MAG: ABC transporter ATP-binding protein [Kosmotoga sp.]|nr:MAG: ABC transporter ATP-binding protein [Kosmotoga sp.]
MEEFILQMKNIHKIYESNNVAALKGADLLVKRTRIHALVGENGAGKTTLMKILCGIEPKNEGEIVLDGKELKITDPRQGFKHGLGMVHQHFRLIEDFTIAENIALGIEKTRAGFIDEETVEKEICRLSNKSGLIITPEMKVKNLSIGEKQKVEILRVLYRGAKIIILDEPTSVLTEQETEELFNTIRMLKKQGKTIIFISHKLGEVKEISDDITILRNGKTVESGNIRDYTKEKISYLMVGEKIDIYRKNNFDEKEEEPETLLDVKNLYVNDQEDVERVSNANITVRKGEIVGVAGVAGNGQLFLTESLIGLAKPKKGQIILCNEDITNFSVRQRREAGLSYIPEDRMRVGVSATSSVLENVIATRYYTKDFSSKGWLNIENARLYVERLVKKYNIKTPSPHIKVGMLSGGNIQKVIISREFSSDPQVLIVCEPTWGLDVRSIEFVYSSLIKMKEKNKGILLISGNLDEILNLSDRILVMYGGKIVASLENSNKLTRAKIGEYMMGLRSDEEKECNYE